MGLINITTYLIKYAIMERPPDGSIWRRYVIKNSGIQNSV
jgi:hypothetical protein